MNKKVEYVYCSELYTPTQKLNDVLLRITSGRIEEILTDVSPAELNHLPTDRLLLGNNLICAPGLIDEHFQGAGGYDFLDAEVEGNEKILSTAAQGGCTDLLATVTISNQDKGLKHFQRVIQAIKETAHREPQGANIIGVHLEGPYISPSRRGGFGIQYIKDIDTAEFQELCELIGDMFRLITIAPELPRSSEVIEYALSRGIKVSIGHTSATFEQAERAFQLGANHITHCFNAMAPIHHREPSAITAGLLNDDVYCEVIADGIHLHPAMLRLLYKIKGAERLILITDATAPCGLPEGTELEGVGGIIAKRDGAIRLPDGTLAGSALLMLDAVKNIHQLAEVPLADALRMASLTPAQSLGLSDTGELSKSKRGNLILFDADFTLRYVIYEGFIIYAR